MLTGDIAHTLVPSGISLGSGSFTRAAGSGQSSIASAADVSALFSLANNGNIIEPTSTPHVTINGLGDGSLHYYEVRINNPGATITADIDLTTGGFDSFVQIRSANGTVLAFDDDSLVSEGAGGSTSTFDSFVSYTPTVAGSYYVVVGSFSSNSPIGNTPNGSSYQLQVSVADELSSSNGGNDTITGGAGNDTIIGGAGNDSIDGGVGNDTFVVSGNQADYQVTSSAGRYTLIDRNAADGNDGIDRLTSVEFIQFADARVNISNTGGGGTGGGGGTTTRPTQSSDNLIGTARGDTIDALAGNDTIDGLAGHDRLSGGAGNDTLIGGAGNDTLNGGSGNDTADYSAATTAVSANLATGRVSSSQTGTDTLIAIEAIVGGSGNDLLRAGSSGANLSGGGGNDRLFGGAGQDVIRGDAGNDTILGRAGADRLFGGAGDDFLIIDAADTVVNGGAGLDRALVQGNADFSINLNSASIEVINSAGGNDNLNGAGMTGRLVARSGTGDDTIIGGNGSNFLYGGAGNDSITGGNGSDVLLGHQGVDYISGGGGNDSIYTDGNDRFIDGGAGYDRLYVLGSNAVSLNLAAVGFEVVSGGAGNDRLIGSTVADRQLLRGNNGDDTLFGGAAADTMFGGNGNDSISGGAGADKLFGGAGDDTLLGGAGDDILFFDASDTQISGGAGLDRAIVQGNAGVSVDVAASSLEIVFGGGGQDILDGTNATQGLLLHGKGGNDVLHSGAGNDRLFGEAGNDQFVFVDNFANDTIVDFANNSVEKINLAGVTGIVDWADLSANHLSQVGADTVITDGVNTITITGVAMASLTMDDFLF